MRILVVTSLYPNPCDPRRAPFSRQQIASLARSNEVRVIAPIAWTDELRAIYRGGSMIPASRRVTCDAVTVDHPRYYFTPKLLRFWHGAFFAQSVGPSFGRAVEEFKPEVVFGAWAYPDAWAAVKLARAAALPVVVKVCGCDVLCGGRGLKSDPIRARRTAEVLRAADGVVAVSRHLAESVASLGVDPQNIRTVYTGVDSTTFHPGPAVEARARLGLPAQERLVLFVGRLDPVKGIDVLLHACAKLRARGAHFRCFIVGDGPIRRALDHQIAELHLSQVVQMMGGRPLKELGDWYRATDLLVAPSHSEGMPNVLLEGMACGARVVATAVGGVPEMAQFAPCTLVPPKDAEALAKAIGDQLEVLPSDAPRQAPIRSHIEAAADLAAFFAEVVEKTKRSPRAGSVTPAITSDADHNAAAAATIASAPV